MGVSGAGATPCALAVLWVRGSLSARFGGAIVILRTGSLHHCGDHYTARARLLVSIIQMVCLVDSDVENKNNVDRLNIHFMGSREATGTA